MRYWLGTLALAGGCNLVFHLQRSSSDELDADVVEDAAADAAIATDLDGDGILDDEDPCVAAMADGLEDEDGDTVINQIDPCPFEAPITDGDVDGIPDACDPFPTAVGDRRHCFMSFTSVALDTALWHPRSTEAAWAASPGELIGDPTALATTIATQSLEGQSVTTYDAKLTIDLHAGFGAVTLWVRASPDAAAPTDVGCRYQFDTAGGFLGIAEGDALRDPHTQAPGAGINTMQLRATVVTTGAAGALAAVTCSMVFNAAARITSSASVPLPAGRAGFTTDHFRVVVKALDILEHP